MRLRVAHVTTYRFSAPMRFFVQSHRLTPSRFDGQVVREWNVAVEGGAFGPDFVDGAGDTITTMSLAGPVDLVEVLVTGVVDTRDLAGVLKGHKEQISPIVYLRGSAATMADKAILALAEKAVDGIAGTSGLDRAHALAAAVAEAIVYAPGETHVQTRAAEALALGKGVCQDHAHVLIAAAVSLGIPARYVSGYLHASADGELHEASHAWAELYVDGLGWVGFDPANRCCPDERYIRLGSGLNALDAAPIRGVSMGAGAEALNVDVAVTAVQQ